MNWLSRLVTTVGVAVTIATIITRQEKLVRLLTELDRRSGLFAPHGSRFYSLFAPHILGGFHRYVVDNITSSLTEGKVLDVGTGPGLLVLQLARCYPMLKVVGVDLSPEMVTIAHENAQREGLVPHVSFEVGDVANLPFGDQLFDLVVSTLSFHHWQHVVESLHEIHRVLRPGGQLWLYELRILSYLGDDLEAAIIQTPFAGQQVERTPLQIGRFPIRIFMRFALHRA